MRPKAPSLELISSAESAEDTQAPGASVEEAPQKRRSPARAANEPPRSGVAPVWRWAGRAGVFVALVVLSACMPPTPAQKATDAARELNMGARWGRMNEAVGWAAPEERADFIKRRTSWHGHLRIVETELTGLNMKDATHATVEVEVSWMFADDPTLRVTRLSQKWSDAEGKWVMLSEKRVGGDTGLFGEEVKRAEKTRDTHFPSRVIH